MKMIFDILKDGLDYVGTNRSNIIVYYLGILVFPLVFIEAYSYHIIENCLNGTINNRDKLPDITLNSEAFVNGVKLLVMKIIYFLPEIIVLLILLNIRPINYFIVTIIMLILSLFSYSISQLAGVCMVDEGSFREGFNFSKIFGILKSVGITYVELMLSTLVIILGIVGVTAIVACAVMMLSTISNALFLLFLVLVAIAYVVFLIAAVPIYVLFKNRATVSTYNLK